ncbi:MAG: hypothetical protein ACE5JZ_09160 [Kiloniellales bacterium]
MSQKHWLVRPQTIRMLWIGFAVILVVLVMAGLWVHGHAYFAFAFNAWYGFAACVAMIVGAKVLGVFIGRRDTYYDD